MQTFLPYPNFRQSARVLDRLRLGKQRVECLQIVNAIVKGSGWVHHPAVKMWFSYLPSLCDYGIACCDEWLERGYKDTCREKLCIERWKLVRCMDFPYPYPSWFGNYAFHRSHQSNLVRKLPSHYRPYFPAVPDNLPYVWPTLEE